MPSSSDHGVRKNVYAVLQRRYNEPDFELIREHMDREYRKALECIPTAEAGPPTETAKGYARGLKIVRDIFYGKP